MWGPQLTRKSAELRDDARFRALRLIEGRPCITQRELADALGISLGATHYMLRAFADHGLVKSARFSTARQKRAYTYILTPRGISEKASIAVRFLARKRMEYDALRAEIEDLRAELERDGKAASKSAPAIELSAGDVTFCGILIPSADDKV